MKQLLAKHRAHWSQRSLVVSSVMGSLFFVVGLYVSYLAANYATVKASNSVTDILLSNIRVFDIDNIIIYGTFVFIAFCILIMVWQPHRIPFGTKSVGLFFFVRAVFISITHTGPFTPRVILSSRTALDFMGVGNTSDLFFSAHTGLPFLLALACWDNKILRYVFLLSSIAGGTIMLLGHIHYSIDVLGAFFVTYTIFHIAQRLFQHDYSAFIEKD